MIRPLPILPALLGMVLLSSSGCLVWHLEKDAPGRVDLSERPAQDVEKTEVPDDPGEESVTWALGPSGSLGALVGGGATELGGSWGLEMSLAYTTFAISHSREDSYRLFLPEQTLYGLNFGWMRRAAQDTAASVDPGSFGDLFAEAQIAAGSDTLLSGLGVGLGWRMEASERLASGPQLTTFLLSGLFYVRAAYLFGRGALLTSGLSLKLPMAWVWSQ